MKTWLMTGTSRGFGRIWAEAALARGDKVAATARSVADLADLPERFGDAVLPLALDVTDPDQARAVVRQAHAHFGRLDVVLNNAGYTLSGTVEEASEADVRALFDANYFGTLRVIQAALPLLRQQRSGHILGVSSGMGIVAMPLIGFYCATKWAVEALHESLAQEVKSFGIKVTLLEPGAYATDFGSPRREKSRRESTPTPSCVNVFSGVSRRRNAAIRMRRQRRSSRSWTRRNRRYVSSSAAAACRWRAPRMPTASRPGRRGRPFRTPRKASHRDVRSHRSSYSVTLRVPQPTSFDLAFLVR